MWIKLPDYIINMDHLVLIRVAGDMVILRCDDGNECVVTRCTEEKARELYETICQEYKAGTVILELKS